MDALAALGIHVAIRPVPTEVQSTLAFPEDTIHASYDKGYVNRWWRIQLQICTVFDRFRSLFRGKSSPIHFFWGSFDLAGTRFNGKRADPPQLKGAMGSMMRFAEDEENFAFGFWPGDERLQHPTFYSYLYPAPQGMALIDFGDDVSFNERLALCILPYEAVRHAEQPENMIMNFLERTYAESTSLAGWDTKSLETAIPPHLKS